MSHHPEGAPLIRQAARTPRAAALAGIAFSVLLTASFLLVRWALPNDPEDAGQWLTDGSRRDAFVLGLNLLPFAGIAFLWFMGVLRDRIGENEDRFFATVFLGSGLLFVAMMFACAAVAGGLVLSYREGSVVPPAELWSFGREVTLALQGVYAMRMAAVFTISATTIASRLGQLPRWLAVFGMGTGLALLFAAGAVAWIEILFPLWVFVFSLHILIATLGGPPTAE